jgi:uncharacterized beta-barrel protein YwiB (DUF1934 family)
VSELKKLKKSVLIDICHTQSLNTMEPLEIQEAVEGALYQVDKDTFIVAYDTVVEGQKVTTTIKVSGQNVSVVKIGDVHSRQTFALEEWMTSQYFYGGNSIVCRNYTKKLDYALNNEGGLIDVLYELWSGDTHLGFYNLELFIQ